MQNGENYNGWYDFYSSLSIIYDNKIKNLDGKKW
jgi:hypothetical protein